MPALESAGVTSLWDTDGPVLAAIVQQVEVEGRHFPDLREIFETCGLDLDAGMRSVRRLDAGHLIEGQQMGGNNYVVERVTGDGLRESRAWPDRADRLAEVVIAALAEAAENEPIPEKRSKLKTAASGAAGVGKDVMTEVVAAYLARVTGAG